MATLTRERRRLFHGDRAIDSSATGLTLLQILDDNARMVFRAFILWSLLALLLLIVALVLALFTVDLGFLKPQLERVVSDVTGRALRIDGRLRIDIGRESVVVVENLSLANAPWAGPEKLLDLGLAELRLDSWSLLSGPITITDLRIDGLDLSLEVDSSGRANWEFGAAASDADDNEEDSGLNLLFSRVLIEDSTLVYLSPERQGPLDFRIEHLGQTYAADAFLQLALRGSLGGRTLEAKGRIGSWPALLEQKNVDFDFDAQVDTLTISTRGRIDSLVAPNRPTVEFSVRAPDINDILRLLQLPADAAGDVNISGSLSHDDAGPLNFAAQGNLGRMTLDADGSLSALQNPQEVVLDVAAAAPDLSPILRLFGVHGIGTSPFDLKLGLARSGSLLTVAQGQLQFADARLDLDARLPNFPSPDDASAHLNITGADLARLRDVLKLPGRSGGAYSAAFAIDVGEDGVEIASLDVESQLLHVTGRARLGEQPDFYGTEIDLEVDVPSLVAVGDLYDLAGLPERGLTVRGAATLLSEGLQTRGPVKLRSGKAQLDAEGLIALQPTLAGTALALRLQGPDLSALVAEFVETPELPGLPYDLSGRIQVEESALGIESLAGTLGSARLEAAGRVSRREGLAGTAMNFRFSGPALEELKPNASSIRVKPGRFDLSGTVALREDSVHVEPLRFERDRADVELSLDLALPLSRREASFDISADGADLHAVIGEPGGFAADVAPFAIDAQGELSGSLVSIRRLEATLGEASLNAAGDLDLAYSGLSKAFRARVEVPSLADIGELNGRRFSDQSLAIDASASNDSDALSFDPIKVRIGASDLNARLRLEKREVPKLLLDLHSDALVVAPLFEPEPFSYDPEPAFADGRLIPDVSLPLELLRRFDADVTVSIAELERDGLRFSDVDLVSTLKDGALIVDNFSFAAASGALRSRASLQPVGESADLALDIVARDFAPSVAESSGRAFGRLSLDASLSASGGDLRQLAASADGVVYVDARGARLQKNRFLRKLYGDMLNEILATINPFTRTDDEVIVACVILPIELGGGRLRTRPAAIVRTNMVRIRSDATVNLETEAINLQVRTTPERGLTLSASELINPFVRVMGTLAEPRLAVDQMGVLISGGAAAATVGVSVLAKAAIDRLARLQDPCKAGAQAGISELGSRFPVFEAVPAQ
jgi:hypothetical protein